MTARPFLPGVSLMTVTATRHGFLVRCPGCCVEQFVTAAAGTLEPVTLHHADAGCPVHRTIVAAFAQFAGVVEPHA